MTTTLARTVIAAAVLLTGVSAASARPGQAPYDNGTLRSQIDLNAPDGARAFWESTQRSGR
jgi:hypothetical protein